MPSWALDSPLLRQALAAANLPAALAIVRSACGLSQRDMAAVAGWSPAALSLYERGQRDAVFDIRVLLQFADAIGMPRGSLLALVLGDPDAVSTGQADETASALASAPPSCGNGSSRVGSAQLAYLRACTDALYRRERKAGGAVLLGPALLLWRQARQSCGGQNPADRVRSATAASIALCAGQFALDSSRLPLAKSLHDAASGLAATAGEVTLNIQVLTARSRLNLEIARVGQRDFARRALVLAREAAEEARCQPLPELHALIAVRQAEAAALLGDTVASRASAARARRELERAKDTQRDPIPSWLRHVDHEYVAAAETRQRETAAALLTAAVKIRQTAGPNTSQPSSGRTESRTAQPDPVLATSTHCPVSQ